MGQALILCPGRELAFIENFDLLLHSFELVAAIFQQLGGPLIATEHLLKRQLTGLNLRNQLLKLLQSSLVAGR